jgi:hypothetical protein
MAGQKQFDRAAFDARVEAVAAHPRFASAKECFCREVPETYLESDFRRTLIADTSCYAVIIAIFGMNRLFPDHGASPSMLVKTLEAGGLASATRVRAYLDELSDAGAITIEDHPHDARRKRIVPTALLIQWERNWFAAVLRAVGEVFILPQPADSFAHTPGVVERYFSSVVLRHSVDRFTIFDDFPEAEAFMQRRHGYLLMIQLAGADGLRTEVARAHLAERFGVSPAHIATMLADAESKGWLTRNPPSSQVELAPDFAARLNTWIARELTIVGMWVEARYGPAV